MAEPAFAGLPVRSSTLAACAGPDPSGANADLVAAGTVEEVTVRQDSSEARVLVDRIFKGQAGETVTVLTGSGSRSGRSIDVTFGEGERYLLYLQRRGEAWTTSTCLGTQPLGETLPPELVAALGEGVASESSAKLPETGGPVVPVLVVLAALGALGVFWPRVR